MRSRRSSGASKKLVTSVVKDMRLLPLTEQDCVVRVSRELRHRGDVYAVFDRHHRLLLIGQSVPKLASAINTIFTDSEDRVSYQALYHMLLGKTVRNYHKGWSIIRLKLDEVPSFWEDARTQPYQKRGYVCESPDAYQVATAA